MGMTHQGKKTHREAPDAGHEESECTDERETICGESASQVNEAHYRKYKSKEQCPLWGRGLTRKVYTEPKGSFWLSDISLRHA